MANLGVVIDDHDRGHGQPLLGAAAGSHGRAFPGTKTPHKGQSRARPLETKFFKDGICYPCWITVAIGAAGVKRLVEGNSGRSPCSLASNPSACTARLSG